MTAIHEACLELAKEEAKDFELFSRKDGRTYDALARDAINFHAEWMNAPQKCVCVTSRKPDHPRETGGKNVVFLIPLGNSYYYKLRALSELTELSLLLVFSHVVGWYIKMRRAAAYSSKCLCGSEKFTIKNHSLIWHDGDVHCQQCGMYIRDFDAG
jgi:hypothetical protein